MIDLFTPFYNNEVPTFEEWRNFYSSYEIGTKCITDLENDGYDHLLVSKEKVFTYTKDEWDRMMMATNKIKKIYPSVLESLKNMFPVELGFEVVVYHGLSNGAGWATQYNNKDAILLGVEKIVELNWDFEEKLTSLLAHEFAHLAHQKLRGHNLMIYTGRKGDIFRMYIEGYATYFENNFFDRTQTMPEWVRKCNDNESQLKNAYLKVLNGDGESKYFYGDWFVTMDIPDTGYYLGYKFIEELSKKYSYIEIGELSFSEIEAYLVNYLES